MAKRLEIQEKECNFNNLILKEIKEDKKEDLVQIIIQVLNSDIKEIKLHRRDIVSASRVGGILRIIYQGLLLSSSEIELPETSFGQGDLALEKRVKFLLNWIPHFNEELT